MKKKLVYSRVNTLIVVLLALLVISCVPQRKYAELEEKYNIAVQSNDSSKIALANLTEDLHTTEVKANEIIAQNARLNAELLEIDALYEKVKESYEQLGDNYRKLIESKSADLAELDKELKDLEEKLSTKDSDLSSKEADLIKQQINLEKLSTDVEKLKLDLELREEKVKELQKIINNKDESLKNLAEKIRQKISSDVNNGLSVQTKNGKIYVSVESKLLFKAGRTDIDQSGEEALIKISEALTNLKDFEIIVEGHTDKQPIKTARFADNWDLSVLRATSVVRLLIEKGNIPTDKIVPSGRGENFPIDEGESAEAFAKNRRIEIIIAPNLSEVYKLLQN